MIRKFVKKLSFAYVRRKLKTASLFVIHPLLSLIFLPCALLLKIFGFRIFGLDHPQSIGHSTLEPDTYLKMLALGRAKKYKILLLAPSRRITANFPQKLACNPALLGYWGKYFYVIRSPYLFALFTLKCWKMLRYRIDEYAMDYKITSPIFSVYHEYRGKPLLQLSEGHLRKGEAVLKKLGLPEGAWFVCFHFRETFHPPGKEDRLFICRDSDVNRVYTSLEMIEKAGGWCIRMGDARSKPVGDKFKQLSRFIDYTKTEYLSDWMDLFLANTCSFFVGSSSGLANLPAVMGVPCVLVNRIPFANFPFSPLDLAIPKLYFCKKRERLLTFSEITSLPSVNYIHTKEFEDDHIEWIDNTEEEIKEVVEEMLNRMQGSASYSLEQIALRQQFASLFRPGNFCYGFKSDIGIAFLEKYRNLME